MPKPKPRKVGNVKRITPALRTAGIRVDHTRAAGGNRARLIILTNTNGGDGNQPSQPSEPSRQGADLRVLRDGTRDGNATGRDGWAPTVPGDTQPSRRSSHLQGSVDLQESPPRDGGDGGDGEIPSPPADRPKTPCTRCSRLQWNALGSPLCGACRDAA